MIGSLGGRAPRWGSRNPQRNATACVRPPRSPKALSVNRPLTSSIVRALSLHVEAPAGWQLPSHPPQSTPHAQHPGVNPHRDAPARTPRPVRPQPLHRQTNPAEPPELPPRPPPASPSQPAPPQAVKSTRPQLAALVHFVGRVLFNLVLRRSLVGWLFRWWFWSWSRGARPLWQVHIAGFVDLAVFDAAAGRPFRPCSLWRRSAFRRRPRVVLERFRRGWFGSRRFLLQRSWRREGRAWFAGPGRFPGWFRVLRVVVVRRHRRRRFW